MFISACLTCSLFSQGTYLSHIYLLRHVNRGFRKANNLRNEIFHDAALGVDRGNSLKTYETVRANWGINERPACSHLGQN